MPRRRASSAVTALSGAPAAEAARAEEMRGQVAVTQAEPVVAAQAPQLVHDRPALAGHAPTGLTVVHAGQGVGDRVEVGADGEAVQLHVVADIDDRRDGVGRDHTHETCEHSSGPHAAAQGHQHEVSIGARGGRAFRPPLVPSPPAMPVRIPSDQHETVVSVLREAARVNGDVEAYVEPDVGAGRHSLTFAEWDRAADGVAGHLAGLGVAKGDVVCLLLPSSIDYAVLYGGLLRLGAITSGINPRMGAGEVASIVDRAAPVLLVVDPEAGGNLDAGSIETVTRAETRELVGGAGAGPCAAAGLFGSGRCGVDEWDHRPAQGCTLRSRQPGRGGPGDRRAEPPGRPPALPAALRPRGLHDPGLGRNRQRRDDHHHAHPVAGGRSNPCHGRRRRDGRAGCPDAVGAHAGQ